MVVVRWCLAGESPGNKVACTMIDYEDQVELKFGYSIATERTKIFHLVY